MIQPNTTSNPNYYRLFFFFGMYIIPPLLIFIGWIDYEYRYHIMAPVIVGTSIYTVYKGTSRKILGMRWDNFVEAALWQVPISIGLVVLAIFLLHSGYVRNLDAPQNPWFYVMYLFISGPVQEFVYRSATFAELSLYQGLQSWQKILLVSLNFAWLHVIYFDIIVFLSALCMGFLWTIIYYYKRNLWAVSVAHASCGFLAIWYGLI